MMNLPLGPNEADILEMRPLSFTDMIWTRVLYKPKKTISGRFDEGAGRPPAAYVGVP